MPSAGGPRLSIVCPSYNEGQNIAPLVAAVDEALADSPVEWELILVNDGSPDDTWAKIVTAAEAEPRVRGINLSRNFGKEAAMLAGLRTATGDAVVIMDADLQHPPSMLPQMIDVWLAGGVDQVIARRSRDGEAWLRKRLSQRYYKIVRSLMDVPLEDGVGDFRLLSRRALDALLSLTESNRFSKGLFAWIGFPSAYVDYKNVTRERGDSSWSLRSLLNYGIDGIIAFNDRPIRVGIHIGFVAVALSFVYLAFMFGKWLIVGVDSPGYLTTIGAIVFVGGLQIILISLVGEYVGRIHGEVKRRPVYLVADDTSVPAAPLYAARAQAPAVSTADGEQGTL